MNLKGIFADTTMYNRNNTSNIYKGQHSGAVSNNPVEDGTPSQSCNIYSGHTDAHNVYVT